MGKKNYGVTFMEYNFYGIIWWDNKVEHVNWNDGIGQFTEIISKIWNNQGIILERLWIVR